MSHFHYPDGRVLGTPDWNDGNTATIGGHNGPIVNPKPYGYAHQSRFSNLPLQPQDPGFTPSHEDVVIEPQEPHRHRNPFPHMLVLST